MNRILVLLAGALLLSALLQPADALDFTGMFKPKTPLTEDEHQKTIVQIGELQLQLKLLQDKLRALEKRRALEAAAPTGSGEVRPVTGEINWQAIDRSSAKPDGFGLYTYLLFAGSEADSAAQTSLENLLQTIETLPENTDPATILNRFLVPVKNQQSMVILARRPYDFKLSRSYLERLGLAGLPNGPVLVSLTEPLDLYGLEMSPPFLAVALGRQEPQRNVVLAKVWHGYEKPPLTASGHPLADLFWQLLDGAGPTRVSRAGGRILIDLTPAIVSAP